MKRTARDPAAGERRWRSFRSGHIRRFAKTFVVVFAAMLAARAALPLVLSAYVERVLDGSPDYECSIGDVDLNLWRGAYEIERIELRREGGGVSQPLLEARRLDLSIAWPALVTGEIVAEGVLHQPTLQIVLGDSEETSQTGADTSWGERLEAIVPFRIDRFVVRDGEVRFHRQSQPPVDLFMTDIYGEARNLTNVWSREGPTPAELEVAGRPFESGEFEARVAFDPLADQPRIDIDAVLRNVDLVEINDTLQAFADVDAEDGTLAIYTELAARDGRVEGYVKTLLEDVQLFSFREIDDPGEALEALWEGFVELGAELLENQPSGRFAARIPIRGDIDNPDASLPETIGSMLSNAFVVALRPAIDRTIEVDDLRGPKRPEQTP